MQLANAQRGFKPLIVSALEHAVNGVTAISEVLRIAQQFEEAEAPALVAHEPNSQLQGTDPELGSELEVNPIVKELTLERLT